ncbi:MAG: flagellar filament capping protein FliD [Nitrospinae bacterium]|nr:flagellar filament capping protein FliD [Nitrospinota bacterium]
MEVSGTQNSFLFTSPFSITGGSAVAVREAQNTLNAAGESRTSKNNLIFDSLVFVARRVPALGAAGPVAGLRLGRAVKSISNQVDSRKPPIVDDFEKKSRFTDLRIDRLNRLRESLNTLRTTVDAFLNNGALNLRVAESSRRANVQVEAGSTAPRVRFSVTPTRQAVNNVIASDEQPDPVPALGLSGTFSVNGFQVTVETTDSIFELRDKINRGEDLNNNGVLDGAEDRDNSGTLDTFTTEATEFGPGLYINEDLNADGVLDPSEDVNNNNRLDGGIAQTRVKANVIRNRLILTSLAGGSTQIHLVDDDGILLELGFFELNSKGMPIEKELQFNDFNPRVNLNVVQQRASIEVDETFADPKTVENDFNEFSNVAEDVVVTVTRESDRPADVQIFIDASTALEQIQTFFEQFNDSLRQINDILAESREFAKDREIQNVRNDLTQETQEKIKEIGKRNELINIFRGHVENTQAIGFSVTNTEKRGVQEVSVTTAAEDIHRAIVSPFSNADRDLSNRLASVGIRTLEDDTFVVDGPQLKRALEINEEETVGLFNDPETGILPVLRGKLENLLRENLGSLDMKRDKVLIRAGAPNQLADKLRKFTENSILNNTVRNLIAVV